MIDVGEKSSEDGLQLYSISSILYVVYSILHMEDFVNVFVARILPEEHGWDEAKIEGELRRRSGLRFLPLKTSSASEGVEKSGTPVLPWGRYVTLKARQVSSGDGKPSTRSPSREPHPNTRHAVFVSDSLTRVARVGHFQ